ncbi:MAG TPA: LysR family transcriptional regulator [Rubrivivax sp.]|nr:LysR family transcriptional regulator [Rubrivivax sp.]
MELRHFRYFEALASTLNFTRAAEKLHISQPPLSRQIQQLEDELGVALLDRTARPLQLTRAGSFFYEQSVQLLARVREIQSATRRLAAGERRWLAVGFVPSMLYGVLPTVLQRFMAEHPELDLLLTELTSVQQAESLKAGRIDIGFGRLALAVEGLVNTLLEEEPLVAVLPARHELGRLKRVSLADLAARTLVLYPAQPRPSFADQVLSQFRARGCVVERIFETNGLQTAIGLVAAGIGVTLVPRSVQRLRRDDVIYRPLIERGISSPTLMTTRAGDLSGDLAQLVKAVQAATAQGARGGAGVKPRPRAGPRRPTRG